MRRSSERPRRLNHGEGNRTRLLLSTNDADASDGGGGEVGTLCAGAEWYSSTDSAEATPPGARFDPTVRGGSRGVPLSRSRAGVRRTWVRSPVAPPESTPSQDSHPPDANLKL
jgi:hypothetical protein